MNCLKRENIGMCSKKNVHSDSKASNVFSPNLSPTKRYMTKKRMTVHPQNGVTQTQSIQLKGNDRNAEPCVQHTQSITDNP